MTEVCGIEYINKVAENLRIIKEEQLEGVYADLSEADCIILSGAGRSMAALEIGMGELDYGKAELKTTHDVGFPGKNLLEAAPRLEEKYENIVLLVNSGRGETPTPKQTVEELVEYIRNSGSKKFKIDAAGSNQNSTIGKAAREYGNFVEVRGREKEPKSPIDFARGGIMNDIYELPTLLLFQTIKEGINDKRDFPWVTREMEREMQKIGRMIDKYTDSEWYNNLIEIMERRSNITVEGLGPSRQAAKMTGIRLQHVKRAIWDEAYIPDSSSPFPRVGDILLLISRSGETAVILSWADIYKAVGAEIYSVVGRKSTLSRKSKSLIIESPSIKFYERATFILSPLPIKLAEILKIPESVIESGHHAAE